MTSQSAHNHTSPAELRYAAVLEVGVRAGLVLLLATFAAYVSGILPPSIALEQLPKYWSLPAKEFVAATHTATGWGWPSQIAWGESASLAAFVFMAGLSAVCLLTVLPIFTRQGERSHLIIAILQVMVLAVAASGITTI